MKRIEPMRVRSMCTALCMLLLGAAMAIAAEPEHDQARGRTLFLTGAAGASVPTAVVGAGNVTVPATAVPCASCHGRDGRGRTESGVAPPDITREALMRPARRGVAPGRLRPAYTESLLIRAVTMGIDTGGNRLDPVMPRFGLSLSDAAALVAYLMRLGSLAEPGLGDRSLVVGTVLRQGSTAMRQVLAAYVDEINRHGGLFGRQLVLQVKEPHVGETSGGAVARVAAANTVFALLAPMIARDEAAAVAAVDAGGVPTVGPLTQRVRAAPRSRYVFYLNGGVEAEGRALANFAASTLGSPAIVADGSVLGQAAAQAAVTALADVGSPPKPMRPGDADFSLVLAGGDPVLWFADRAPVRLAVTEPAGKQPTLLLPSALAGDLLASGASAPTYVAFATGPAEITPEAATELRTLVARNDMSPQNWTPQDRSRQRFALAAAKILIEALQRAGRDVTRERLVDTLERFQDYRTGLMPPVSFSASRHVGTDGVWIVPLAGGAAIWWNK
jgi:ABC-type branched-subunit amino acid transport system substrate-binding protein